MACLRPNRRCSALADRWLLIGRSGECASDPAAQTVARRPPRSQREAELRVRTAGHTASLCAEPSGIDFCRQAANLLPESLARSAFIGTDGFLSPHLTGRGDAPISTRSTFKATASAGVCCFVTCI